MTLMDFGTSPASLSGATAHSPDLFSVSGPGGFSGPRISAESLECDIVAASRYGIKYGDQLSQHTEVS